MKLDISNVRYSKRDIEKGIKIPTNLCEELAEDRGIHIGDGSLHRCNSQKSSMMFSYSGNILEKEYINHIFQLKKKLYNVNRVNQYIYGNEIRIRFHSLAIATFYSNTLGIPIGSKKDFAIPSVIENCNDKKIISAFLKGIIDTDFGLIVRTKYGKIYPSLVGNFANINLVLSLKDLFEKLGIECFVEERVKTYHKKVNKYYIGSRINLNGYERVSKWLNLIGFNNPKYNKKIKNMGLA